MRNTKAKSVPIFSFCSCKACLAVSTRQRCGSLSSLGWHTTRKDTPTKNTRRRCVTFSGLVAHLRCARYFLFSFLGFETPSYKAITPLGYMRRLKCRLNTPHFLKGGRGDFKSCSHYGIISARHALRLHFPFYIIMWYNSHTNHTPVINISHKAKCKRQECRIANYYFPLVLISIPTYK